MHVPNKGHYHLQQNEGNQVEGMLKMIRSLARGTALHWLPFCNYFHFISKIGSTILLPFTVKQD